MSASRPIRSLNLLLLMCIVAVISILVSSHPAVAANEAYTWKDNRTITVSGPDLRGTSDLVLVPGAHLTGDMSAVFAGNVLYNKGPLGCTVSIQIYLFKASGNGNGRTWNPPPYGGAVISQPGTAPTCYNAGFHDLDPAINDQWVTIAGTRPGDGEAPERDEEKQVIVTIFAPDPLSKAPQNEKLTIKKNGKTVTIQTVPFEDDSGAEDWPPNQTPAAARATFKLDPGEYEVCDNYVIPACEKFTKVKYVPLLLSYGKQFQTPDKKRINVAIEYHTKRPCGSTLSINPIHVELTKPDGSKVGKETNGKTVTPGAQENGQLCTVRVIVGLGAVFDNMPPGNYKACAVGAESCVLFEKKDGEAADVTLVVTVDDIAPPDQKVCTTGEGIAGAIAWILCPFTELVAKSTDFFEKNIIIPFMTISPLTTNAKNPIYILWSGLRDFANVGFVVAMFFSIFSIALSKYGMKRLLPRMLLVALGINLSYFLIAFVIDAFNIFGGGLSQLVISALQQTHAVQLKGAAEAGPVQSIFAFGGAAILAVLVTAGSGIGWLGGAIMLASIVVLVVVVVLAIRQMAIITLTVISPVAILASMLPNTEEYFTRWRKMFLQLLIMYPLMVLLFASGKILGMLLQQPGYILAGGDISAEVADGIRVILQFLVYVLPLVFLPALFAASGTLISRTSSALSGRFIQPQAQKLKEDGGLLAQEAKFRMANSSVPGLNRLAGGSQRRDFIREQRKRNLQREQEEQLSSAVGGTGLSSRLLRYQASGVGGESGRTRAAAQAAKVASKGRTQDLEAEMSLLNNEMRRIGMDEKSFASATTDYLKDPGDVSKQVITGANGQTFSFVENKTKLQRALLNSAASQGEVQAIEAARLNSSIDQTMVDDIVRRNDGPLKGAGGYYLATDFGLAHGRNYNTADPASRDQATIDMHAQRIRGMANSGINSILGMNYGLLEDTKDILDANTAGTPANAHRGSVLAALTPEERTSLRDKLDQALSPRSASVLAQADVSRETLEKIRDNL